MLVCLIEKQWRSSTAAPGASLLYNAHPAALVISAGLKFGPVRDLFEGALRGLVGFGNELTGAILHKAIVGCIRGCHKLRMPEWIADNAGVQHHSGFLPFVQRLGILVKEDIAQAANGVSVVELGQLGTLYRVVGLSGDLRRRLDILVDRSLRIREHLIRPFAA